MARGKHAEPTSKRILRDVISLLIMIAIVLVLSWLLRTFVFGAYQIPSGSMEDTIATGDMVIAEKISYRNGEPEKGQIITFSDPSGERDSTGEVRTLIKRVIATGGQVVNVSNGNLYINGVLQNESYVDGKPTYGLSSSTVTYPYTVPAGYVWVMGDNRTNSQDSRYFGAIPITSVTGKAILKYWPLDHFGTLD